LTIKSLKSKNTFLHNKINQSIEKVYKNNLHEHYAVLAGLFVSGDNFENGAKYCRLAAKKAKKSVSLNDTIAYGEKQVTCLEKLPKTESLEKNIIDARTGPRTMV
jgi:predicted negative regulator of RcsB-dependent stress response